MKVRQNLSFSTLVNLLRWRSNHDPELRSYTFLLEGDEPGNSLTCQNLDQRARAIAAMLQSVIARGDRVLLLFPPGLEFVTAFFGCLYAGGIAVPTQLPPSRPRRTHNWQRFESIATNSGPSAVLTSARSLEIRDGLNECVPLLRKAHWIGIEDVPGALAEDWKDPNLLPGSIAFLQYTSGSTALPKGVMVTHENLLYNLEYINEGFQHSAESVGLTWLPHFHDMGLIDGLLEPVYAGFPSYLMSPLALLQNPNRWLTAISRFRVSHSGGPNFAYDLCVRKIAVDQRENLDLSCWAVAYNGAEPVRARTLREFVKAFGPCGFRPESFYPAYGLAEATLKVSGGRRGNGPVFRDVDGPALENHRVVGVAAGKADARTLVGSGAVSLGTSVVIVSPDSLTLCSDGQVGEIWVSGPGVASGYWERPLETEETFRAYVPQTGDGPFLRTGDLGFLSKNE